MLPARRGKKIGEIQMASGHWPSRKTKKLTFEFVVLEPQLLQIPKVPKGLGDGSLIDKREGKISDRCLVIRHLPSQKYGGGGGG